MANKKQAAPGAATSSFRSRIKGHAVVKASSLTPHPLNPRTHGEGQRTALNALLAEVGMARSLLAYEDPEWGLTLIDGHLRREELGDGDVTVEVLDVNREEANKLLLSMDPLAALAGFDEARLASLRDLVTSDDDNLKTLWANVGRASADVEQALKDNASSSSSGPKNNVEQSLPENWLVIIECEDEQHQRDVLTWVKAEGCEARAVIS